MSEIQIKQPVYKRYGSFTEGSHTVRIRSFREVVSNKGKDLFEIQITNLKGKDNQTFTIPQGGVIGIKLFNELVDACFPEDPSSEFSADDLVGKICKVAMVQNDQFINIKSFQTADSFKPKKRVVKSVQEVDDDLVTVEEILSAN